MSNQRLYAGGGDRSPGNEALRKLSVLVRLKEALDSERFEECGELVRKAKKNGAQPHDIRQVIDQSLQGTEKPQRPQTTIQKGRSLRRF